MLKENLISLFIYIMAISYSMKLNSFSAFFVVSIFYANVLIINYSRFKKYKNYLGLFLDIFGIFFSVFYIYEATLGLNSDYKLSIFAFMFLSFILVVVGFIGVLIFIFKGRKKYSNFQTKIYSKKRVC